MLLIMSNDTVTLKNVTVRQAQVHLTKLLRELPVEITRYGKPVARIIPLKQKPKKMRVVQGGKPVVKPAYDKPIEVVTKPKKKDLSQFMCEHNKPTHLCKFDKCRRKAYGR